MTGLLAATIIESLLLVLASLLGGAFIAELLRGRREERKERERTTRERLQAVRLVLGELEEIDFVIRRAVESTAWWTAQGRLRLPVETWHEYRDVLAATLDPGPWRLTVDAFQLVNDLNSRLGNVPPEYVPRSSARVREVWRSVRAAVVELDASTGPRGVFGASGYISEEELERHVWDRTEDDIVD